MKYVKALKRMLFLMLFLFVFTLFPGMQAEAGGGVLGGRSISYEINSVSWYGNYIDVKGWMNYAGIYHYSNQQSYYVRVHDGGTYVGTYYDINDYWVDHTELEWAVGFEKIAYQDIGFHFRIPAQDLLNSGHDKFTLEVHISKGGIGDYGKDLSYVAPNTEHDTGTYKMVFDSASQTTGIYVDATMLKANAYPQAGTQLYVNGIGYYLQNGDRYVREWGTMTGTSFQAANAVTWFQCRSYLGGYEWDGEQSQYRVHPSASGGYYVWCPGNFAGYVTEDFMIRLGRSTYTITYKPNGGTKTDGSAASDVKDTVSFCRNHTIRGKNTFYKMGYSMADWRTNANGSGTAYSPGASRRWTNASNLTVYARWTLNTYRLTYNKNNPATATVGASDITLSKASQTTKYDSSWGTLATASKPGYVFLGWFTEPEGGEQITASTICTGKHIVDGNGDIAYAHWRPIEYMIEFKPNGDHAPGTVTPDSMDSIKVKYDEKVALPANLFKKTTLVPSEDVVRDENGAAVTNPDGSDQQTTVAKPSVFLGWNGNGESLTPVYRDQAQIMNLTKKDGDTITFYAIWDDAPKFTVVSYPDRYFTVEEAQGGMITEEELLKTVQVYDRETNLLPTKTSDEVLVSGDEGVTVVNFDPDEFTGLTDDGSVSVRYKVKDGSSNSVFLNITVWITKNGMIPSEEIDYYRSISNTYEGAASGEGGLADLSRWKGGTYQESLNRAMEGTAKSYDLTLTKGQLSKIRDYVAANGFGNSESDSALNEFWDAITAP